MRSTTRISSSARPFCGPYVLVAPNIPSSGVTTSMAATRRQSVEAIAGRREVDVGDTAQAGRHLRRAARPRSRRAPRAAPLPRRWWRCRRARPRWWWHRRRRPPRRPRRPRPWSSSTASGSSRSGCPHAWADSTNAVPSRRRIVTGVGRPSGPATVTTSRSPPSESCRTSTNPGPPSAIGSVVSWSSGAWRDHPSTMARAASGAVSVPANASGATSTFIGTSGAEVLLGGGEQHAGGQSVDRRAQLVDARGTSARCGCCGRAGRRRTGRRRRPVSSRCRPRGTARRPVTRCRPRRRGSRSSRPSAPTTWRCRASRDGRAGSPGRPRTWGRGSRGAASMSLCTPSTSPR